MIFILSNAAKNSIAEISEYTALNFGINRVEPYLTGLENSLELITKFTKIGVAIFEVKYGLRRYRYQSHYIYYIEHDDHILIEDILHVSRNIRKDLFDT